MKDVDSYGIDLISEHQINIFSITIIRDKYIF